MYRLAIAISGSLLFHPVLHAQTGVYTTEECVYSVESFGCYGESWHCTESECDVIEPGQAFCAETDRWLEWYNDFQYEHMEFDQVSEEDPLGFNAFTWQVVDCGYFRPCHDECDYILLQERWQCNADLSFQNSILGMRYTGDWEESCEYDACY